MVLDQTIIEALKNGKTILYPTDTIWGIGCDATNEQACQRILEIKQRPKDKSFILLVDSFQMIEKYIPEFPAVCYDLADLADKPLTIIYPNAQGLAPSVLAEDGSVGIRITKDPICLALIRSIRLPLVSTSANISGKPFPTNFSDINSAIKQQVEAILELKTNEQLSTPSQIIKIGLDSSIQVIRS
ncbi:L-threonylcarbamoyladenylate synthase [Fluviicola taffensis]|uniref:L-threonylcarbamoyladenylate synthase n=1 Tax=Fluviicola taffensis (strain DSM 16823 / NCIMB 13979 / RW262) TaxID=755732 RepID=F2IH41_FLUTR|nr:L-threonylcarbamoyladenylate synthase [Fluviicola taffensis]AEA45855.1 Sua5/YciO/YrdC/YwlC family protein [Fluviicola taffensis DSM 16823]